MSESDYFEMNRIGWDSRVAANTKYYQAQFGVQKGKTTPWKND